MENNLENNLENPTLKLADDNFKSWNEALEKGEAKEVAKKYLEEGELFGTVSAKIRKGQKEIEGYFDHFLEIDPSGEVIERKTINISTKAFLDSGLYNFQVTRDGKKQTIEAMFTYIWQKDENGEWKIKHHHSAVKDENNEKLSSQKEVLDLRSDNIKWGTDKEISKGIFLRTGFLKQNNNLTSRFTYLVKNSDNEAEETIYQQISVCPEDQGV